MEVAMAADVKPPAGAVSSRPPATVRVGEPTNKTPSGHLLTFAEVLALVQNRVIKPKDMRRLIWGK